MTRFCDQSVLELGAGLGLCGMVAALAGARVVLTDGDEDVLDLCRANIASNEAAFTQNVALIASTLSCLRLRWGAASDDLASLVATYPHGFDVLLASDVLYRSLDDVRLLMQTVAVLLALRNDSMKPSMLVASFQRRSLTVEAIAEVAAEYRLVVSVEESYTRSIFDEPCSFQCALILSLSIIF